MGFFDFLFLDAARKGIEKSNNEIKFDNFVPQARKEEFLTLIPQCKIQESGMFGNYTRDIDMENKLIKGANLDLAHLDLYDYLVKKNVITTSTRVGIIFSFDSTYTINKDKISVSDLKQLIKKENSDFPKLLKCYNINYEKLSDFLKNYDYKLIDEAKALLPGDKKGGKRKKHKKNKTKRRKNP